MENEENKKWEHEDDLNVDIEEVDNDHDVEDVKVKGKKLDTQTNWYLVTLIFIIIIGVFWSASFYANKSIEKHEDVQSKGGNILSEVVDAQLNHTHLKVVHSVDIAELEDIKSSVNKIDFLVDSKSDVILLSVDGFSDVVQLVDGQDKPLNAKNVSDFDNRFAYGETENLLTITDTETNVQYFVVTQKGNLYGTYKHVRIILPVE